MTYKTKTRITFDFNNQLDDSQEKLEQIVCSSYWGSSIDILGLFREDHNLLFRLLKNNAIVIDECEYKLEKSQENNEMAQRIKSMLGKRSYCHIFSEMATLFADELIEMAEHYRNTIYLPSEKAFVRADGMKPEDIAEMLSCSGCEKIILFPYYPLDEKKAYYELTLNVPKAEFIDFMNSVREQRFNRLHEAITQANERSKAGYKSTLRLETKADRETVERITYRAFLNAEHASGDEALLAHKLRSCASFVPKLDYVAELDGSIIGNIMYTRSKVVSEDNEWETLTFGPVSVLPKYQRQGVGSALITKTLDIARELGFRAVLIYGHESYYPRFGFKPASEFGITTADGKNFPAFMALPLYDGSLEGVRGRLICDDIYFTLDKAESDALNEKLSRPMDVIEYIEAQPLYYQQFLYKVRSAIYSAINQTATASSVVEKISYQMPTFWNGRNLIHFAAFKRHIGIYPGAEAMVHFRSRLYRYKTSKGAIQLPYQDFGDKQLDLISEIATWCAENNPKQKQNW